MQKNTSYKKIAYGIIAFLLFVLCGSFCWIFLSSRNTSSMTANIYQEGNLIKSIPLDTVTAPYEFTVTGKDGCTNVISVRQNEIGMISADCPDKICVNQGFIHSDLLPITCLPNRLVIRLETNTTPDAVTGGQ